MSKSSAAILKSLYERFAAQWSEQFPGIKRMSARTVSSWLSEKDKLSMARWTNETAHTGAHPNWRIPLYRVHQACDALQATEAERDELMSARMQEALVQDPDGDLAVVLHWLDPLFEELAQRPALSAAEQAVLEAFRRAGNTVTGGGAAVPISETFIQQVETSFEKCIRQAFEEDIESAGEAELTPEERSRLNAKLTRIGDKLRAASRQKASPQPRAVESVTARARRTMLGKREEVRAFLLRQQKERRQLVRKGLDSR